MGSTAALLPQRREAHLPLLLHPHPRRALFLGTGTGITLGAALEHPGLRADGVELVPDVVAVMPRFAPENGEVSHSPRASMFVADARRFVRTTRETYDVIVADVFHPARDGAGALYTREQFEAIRQRLNPGGLFCQWLPLHQLDEATLRLIVRSFLPVFPEARACLLHFSVDIPVLGLLGRNGGERSLVTEATELHLDPPRQAVLRDIGLTQPWQIFGTFVAGPEALQALAGDSPSNTDDRPLVMFTAPRGSPKRSVKGAGLLLALLKQVAGSDALLAMEPDDHEGERVQELLGGYMAARDIYLQGLVHESSGAVTTALEVYLESARRSLHFTPAYARSVNIIALLARTNPEEARRWFERLEQAQPDQPLGRQLLAPLFEGRSP
jgi:spermidine synthase